MATQVNPHPLTDERVGRAVKKVGIFIWKAGIVLAVPVHLIDLMGTNLAWNKMLVFAIGYLYFQNWLWHTWDAK